MAKVTKIDSYVIYFDDGSVLTSDHEQSCCENHYLSFEDLTMKDFEGLDFNLSGGEGYLFNKIEDYGIELIPVIGHSIKIPGYGYNNGYYSDNLTLVIGNSSYDITECQVVND